MRPTSRWARSHAALRRVTRLRAEYDALGPDDLPSAAGSSGGDEDASQQAATHSAPPLPSWAFGPGGDPQRNASAVKDGAPRIVITKGPPVEKKQEATGYVVFIDLLNENDLIKFW